MAILVGILITLFILGSINYFIVLLNDITGLTEIEEIYIKWSIGLGWIWMLVLLPIFKVVQFIQKKRR